MTIWAPKMQGQACTKIPYKDYEISIAMDDSCGVMEIYGRSSIAVFDGHGDDVSSWFWATPDQRMIDATAENLIAIFSRIDQKSKSTR